MCREGLLQLCESWVLHGRTVVVALSLANFIFASSMSSILFALHWATCGWPAACGMAGAAAWSRAAMLNISCSAVSFAVY